MLRQPEVVLERLEALSHYASHVEFSRCALEFLRRKAAQNPKATNAEA